jgi:hypothetical protein
MSVRQSVNAPSNTHPESGALRGVAALAGLLCAGLALAIVSSPMFGASAGDGPLFGDPYQPIVPPTTCTAELRSWVVAGRGRHMYLFLDCPDEHDHLDGRIEYTSAMQRRDYRFSRDASTGPRIARFTRTSSLASPFGIPADNRLEAEYEVTLEQARCLQADRMYDSAYVLLGPNSSSGLREAMRSCGLELPEAVARAGGAFGEFPGVDSALGPEIPKERWALYGFPDGPTPVPPPLLADDLAATAPPPPSAEPRSAPARD